MGTPLKILLCLLVSVELSTSASSRVKWNKYVDGCRKEIVYKQTHIRKFAECKKRCALDDRCLFFRHDDPKDSLRLINRMPAPFRELTLRLGPVCIMGRGVVPGKSRNVCGSTTVYEKALPIIKNPKWFEYRGLCRAAKFYTSHKLSNINRCKEMCAKDKKCAMIKYSKKARKCHLATSNKMKYLSKCHKKDDYYVKDSCVQNRCETRLLCFNKGARIDCVGGCPAGFSKHGKVCKDIDECANRKTCGRHGKCENLVGHYKCVCKKGYKQDGKVCVKDACALNPCKGTLLCLKKETGGVCVKNCPAGFSKHGKNCKDIDECTNPKTCGHHEKCENLVGHHKCVCKKGYKRDGKVCVKDACALNPCKGTLLCLKKETGGDCVKNCPAGFSKHGTNCKDIDECANPKTCGRHGKCENLVGHHKCVCKKGYKQDGKVCVKAVPIQNLKWFEYRGLCRAAKFNTSHQLSNVSHCKEMCAKDKKCAMVKYSEKAKKCHLATSNKMKYLSKCHEKDDYYVKDACVPNLCNMTSLCLNKGTGADCVKNCPVGFSKHGKNCKDIDECANPKTCGHHGKCENLVGHYKCVCKKGYKRHGKVCVKESRKKPQRHEKRAKTAKTTKTKKLVTDESNAAQAPCGLSQIVTAVLLVIGITLY